MSLKYDPQNPNPEMQALLTNLAALEENEAAVRAPPLPLSLALALALSRSLSPSLALSLSLFLSFSLSLCAPPLSNAGSLLETRLNSLLYVVLGTPALVGGRLLCLARVGRLFSS